jgi:fructuronate reductase
LGVRDAVPVPTETFTMWVLEDTFVAGRPAWEAGGAIFTDEVRLYELIKLRLLNGCYSLLSTLGVLAGLPTNPEAIGTDYIAACVRAAQRDDYLPTLRMPTGFDVAAYCDDLTRRWGNTALADATYRVATDGSTKLAQRIAVPADFALRHGRMPQQLALTAAAWICVACPPPGFDPGPLAALVAEPKADAMARATAGASGVREHVRRVMAGGFLPDVMTRWESFDERVADFAETIVRAGVKAAALEALGGAAA